MLIGFSLSSCSQKFDVNNFAKTRWILRTWSGDKLLTNPWLIFEGENKFTGKSFCNSYGGRVSITEKAIKFEDFFSTKKFCKELTDLENIYFNDLKATDYAKVINGKLFLYKIVS